jgi:hypothetical protein
VETAGRDRFTPRALHYFQRMWRAMTEEDVKALAAKSAEARKKAREGLSANRAKMEEAMKKIEVYIQPYSLDAVAEALAVEGVMGMTVTECKGFGVQRGFTRGEDVKPGQYVFHPKMKVEMVVVEPEVEGPLTWQLAFFVPVALLERYVGPIGPLAGQEWRANLYKCGDGTSHPHWASWSPVDALNFHLPHCFGTLRFL